MPPFTTDNSAYPPANVAVACAVAAISVFLPCAPANARRRLAAVMAECYKHGWSDATEAALARRETAWFAIACWLGQSVRDLQHLNSGNLLVRLCESSNRASEVYPQGEPTDEKPMSVEPMTNVDLISTKPRQRTR
jgi:hypothetical protein